MSNKKLLSAIKEAVEIMDGGVRETSDEQLLVYILHLFAENSKVHIMDLFNSYIKATINSLNNKQKLNYTALKRVQKQNNPSKKNEFGWFIQNLIPFTLLFNDGNADRELKQEQEMFTKVIELYKKYRSEFDDEWFKRAHPEFYDYTKRFPELFV